MPIKTRLTKKKQFRFVPKHQSLTDILSDHDLASLGDAYVNLICSLGLSKKQGKPVGKKVDSFTLSSALRKAGLRRFLPSRTDRHKQADAAEALIVYAWLVGAVSLEESLCAMEKVETMEESFCLLLQTILKKLNLNHEKSQ